MKRILPLSIASFLISICMTHAQEIRRTPDITAEEIQKHIKYLASDELEGRGSGTKGNRLAAMYIADEFRSYHLTPVFAENSDYFQTFQVTTGLKLGTHNSLSTTVDGKKKNYVLDDDFRPVSITSDTSITAGLAFVGYGISSDTLKFDEYAGMNVQNKIVMIFRFTPDIGKADSKYTGWESLYRKALIAREKGAAGIIFVTGPADEQKPDLMPLRFEQRNEMVGLPVVNLKSTTAQMFLHEAGVSNDLKSLQQKIYDSKAPASFDIPNATVTIETDVEKITAPTANVAGYIEGTDLKNEVIVVGAHLDHLGYGGIGSGSLKPDTVAIHHGADDNASGTAGVLELAQYFSEHRSSLRRSILFLAFSGEEMGLIGSQYYVNHPAISLDRTVAMVNMDMIGRMKDSALIVEGIGTCPPWESVLKKENKEFNLKLKPGGFGPSDHSSFYGKKIPVLFFFTNLHEDYHRPSDTWDKIQYPQERKVLEYASRVITDIADDQTKPVFVQVKDSSSTTSGDRRETRVSLGVVPDYAEDIVGLKISGTRPGSAAEKAGLKGGDVIIKYAGKAVKNIYDFTYLLGEGRPGQKVEIVVKRGNDEVTLSATLEARKQ